MQLFMPTDFSEELPSALAADAKRITFYGQGARSPLGGGRPRLFLPDPTEIELAAHIKKVQSMGFRFSYLVNAACTGGLETTKEGIHSLRQHLEWICSLGVDEITVSLPLIARLIKEIAPQMKVNAGLFARITNLKTAIRWRELGAEKLTLFLNLNRDFARVKEIKTKTGAEIELIATLSCLDGCIDSTHCASLLAHASNQDSAIGVVPTVYNCYLQKLKNPYELLRSGWIRPEDQSYYEEAGVDVIKITERYDSTETLITKARAYLTQNYSGNFFDLLSLHPRRSGKISAVKTKRYLNKAGLLQQAKIHKLLEELPELYLDNRQLDGFLSYFLEKDCEDLLCSECGHCAKFAAKIFATGLPEAVARIEGLLASMQSGELFSSEKD